jgi:hypothetical protein
MRSKLTSSGLSRSEANQRMARASPLMPLPRPQLVFIPSMHRRGFLERH